MIHAPDPVAPGGPDPASFIILGLLVVAIGCEILFAWGFH